MPSCLLPRWSNPLSRPAGCWWWPYLCHFSFPCSYISFLARQYADDTVLSSPAHRGKVWEVPKRSRKPALLGGVGWGVGKVGSRQLGGHPLFAPGKG